MQPSTPNPFWSLIDGVFVINLDQRPDRWTQFQTMARDIIPAEKLHHFSACLGRELPGFSQRPWFRGGKRDRTWAGRAGCLLSHRRALLKARDLGWRTTLLLEDDAVFAPDFARLADALATALRDNDWDVCYLGFTEPWSPGRQLTKLGERHALHQIHGATTTHAYLVREPARDWILAQLPDESHIWPWLATHRAIDRWYQRRLGLEFRVVCVTPSLVNQDDSTSDIVIAASPAGLSEAAIAPASGSAAYYLGHAFRRVSVRLGLAGDALRGWTRRLNGF
ncbi:MAG: glycosyltransferase family 25 protein [Verrucomicrobiota bacterium]